jgi:hypothetical protein
MTARHGAVHEKSKAIKSPTTVILFYAAGFFEGEGYATVAKNENGCRAQAGAGQKDPTVLYFLRDYFGGNVGYDDKADFYTWRLTGMHARGFLMTMYRMLTPRRKKQIRRALLLDGVTVGEANVYDEIESRG